MNAYPITNCQSCKSPNLKPRFFAGYIPAVNAMQSSSERLRGQEFYPAQLLECPECTLVQMGCVVAPHILFPFDYPYTSGTTKALRDNFNQLANECIDLLAPSENGECGDLVVDIGSNDGTLLANFKDHCRVLGIEPTDNAITARDQGIPSWQIFFRGFVADEVVRQHGKAQLVTCCNCFAHMDDIHDVLKGITTLLTDDGTFVCEVQYLPQTLKGVCYDTAYHEHIFFYSLTSLSHLLSQHGLNIIDAKEIPTHGGSIRVWAKREGTMSKRAMDLMLAEKESLSDEKWKEFDYKVKQSKGYFWREIVKLCEDGWEKRLRTREKFGRERIYGIGAPSRSTVLIHYLGLDEDTLDCVCEVPTSKKIGHFIPGTAIPIVDEECLYRDQPEYALMLSWHIADELIPKIRERGFAGKFIIPLPKPRIVG